MFIVFYLNIYLCKYLNRNIDFFKNMFLYKFINIYIVSGASIVWYRGMDHAFIDKCGIYPQAQDCLNEISKDIKAL
jgi:hypothetical protein